MSKTENSEMANGSPGKTRNILIVDFDLYKNVGGGQTSYKRLVELFPENTYYYFVRDEPASAKRPENTRTIPFSEHYYANIGDLPAEMMHFYHDYLHCWQLAKAVQKELGEFHFDVVDSPDYVTTSLFIRHAFSQHGIGVGTVALALHGTITSAIRDLWPHTTAPSRLLAEVRMRERLQYRNADVRYALSQSYAEEWKAATGIPARPLDPLLLVGDLEPVEAPGSGKPDVLFIGRKERRKGPDIFVDIGWSLEPGSYKRVMHIGADSAGANGVSSADILPAMSALRKFNVDNKESLDRSELDARFRDRTIVVLPSRYDQFNLVALEALRLGCPVFVARSAGVSHWIETHYPELSDLVIDIDCSRTAAGAVREALKDYDALRQRVVKALSAGKTSGDLEQGRLIYSPEAGAGPELKAARTLDEIFWRFTSFNRPRLTSDINLRAKIKKTIKNSFPTPALNRIRSARHGLGRVRHALRTFRVNRGAFYRMAGRAVLRMGYVHIDGPRQIINASEVEGVRHRLLHLGERTNADIANKLAVISSDVGGTRVARSQIFRDMARLERKRGGDLIAATYYLRVMRWMNRDVHNDLPFVKEVLERNNFAAEARAAEAMFGDPATADTEIRKLLIEQYESNLTKPDLPFEILDDRRGNVEPKVSVIVSLYNAESKLSTLLDNMRIQSLARQGLVEVVLVDSGSPTNEYEVFKAYEPNHDLPIVYARSQERETIQAAWNRGIKLARAPYLSFLGVDEGLHPDALSILAEKLDTEPTVDWVMADSIVTEVDSHGVFVKDVMTYDRQGYDQNLVALETCYLSWVGGLYRKSIHDRFGYYDETFRAAGDTEFKSRILPHINTLHVPQMLGVFNNYPEERTTQHPRAEIEDLRSWYLHRTKAGIAYGWDGRPVERAEQLFRQALSYRKSYCWHISTDYDMADSVARYLVERGESGEFAIKARAASQRLLGLVQASDTLDFQRRPIVRQYLIGRNLMAARRLEVPHQIDFGLPERPTYRLFNDNRYEQHWWSWSA
ncbi:glycosyltransferase [Hoeflea sp.]|uniref:glycosyltransferase n=1 Tax=Hoeflea sp. TaxID=1940281 RepID=UPI003B517B45